ncbi:MAG: LysR family transcriptional regulator [Deltaproteobacteria bacterium]|nr:LysR family transcriptional regulator [Deltaproteobacteria bacterium]
MHPIPFAQLQAFLAVARSRSFSGASRELGVSRSAVSQSVRQLEAQLGVVLVQRTTRSVALTEAGVVGAPKYLADRGTPRKPEELLAHECITFRSPTNNALYAWELERGRKSWRLPVRGGIVTNDGLLCGQLAREGLGLAYVPEPHFSDEIRRCALTVVLEAYAPTVPGYFIYYPSRAQRSTPLRLFIEVAKALLLKERADST